MKTYIALAIISLSAFVHQTRAENRVDLGSQALSNIRGAMGVNMVAGNNNQQGNLAAIALSGPATGLGAEPDSGAGRDQSGCR